MSESIHTMATTQHPGLQRLALLATGSTGADIERLVREVRRKAMRAAVQKSATVAAA